MSYNVLVGGKSAEGRIATPRVRRPWGVSLLHLVPLYSIYWIWDVNGELREAGEALGDHDLTRTKPVLSLLAVFPGGLLIVPAVITYFRTAGRIRRLGQVSGQDVAVSGALVLVLAVTGVVLVIPMFVLFGYLQSRANRVWSRFNDNWGMATGEAAEYAGRRGHTEVPLCASCISKMLTGSAKLEAAVAVRTDNNVAVCDVCEKPLPTRAGPVASAAPVGA